MAFSCIGMRAYAAAAQHLTAKSLVEWESFKWVNCGLWTVEMWLTQLMRTGA